MNNITLILFTLKMNFIITFLLSSSIIYATTCSSISKCLDGSCCSKYGYCGTTDDYCNLNKIVPILSKSECNSSTPCANSKDCCSQYGYCGKTEAYCKINKKCDANLKCTNNACCSEHGYCGHTPEYCNLKKIVPMLSQNECNSSDDCHGACCSKYGFCGTGMEYCGTTSSTSTSTLTSTLTLTPTSTFSLTSTLTSTLTPTSTFSSTLTSTLQNTNSPNLIALSDSNMYGIVCGGAIAIGANSNVFTSVITGGAFSIGAYGIFSGDIDCIGALVLGASAKCTGNTNTQAAATLGANAVYYGNVYAVGAVSLGADANLNGNIISLAAITSGAGALITGTTKINSINSSKTNPAIKDVRNAYNTMMSLSNGVQLTIGILSPGLYKNTGAFALAATDTITFNGTALDTWIIQIIGASIFSGNIKLIGGAVPTNIRWVISGAVSVADSSVFYGSVFSLAALSTGANSHVTGRMYSTDGACSVAAFGTFNYA